MKCLALLLSILSAAGLAAAEGADGAYKVQIFGWSYGRERKTIKSSNRVTAMFTAKNISQEPVNDLVVTITYKEGNGNPVHDPVSQKVGTLKPGEIKKVSVVGDFIPVFGAYTLMVEHAGKTGKAKEEWYANSDIAQPEPKSGELMAGVACVNILGKECGTDKGGLFKGTIRVFNEGALEATNCKLTALFYDDNKKLIKEWTGPLGTGKMAGGEEATVPFSVPGAPRIYKSYELKVKFDDTSAETQLSGGEFTSAQDVEVAKFTFKRKDPSSPDLQVAAQVRNGLKSDAEEVKVTLIFRGAKNKELKRHTYALPGALKAGEIKPIEFTVAGIPAYEAFEQKIDYKTGSGPGAASAKGKSESKAGVLKFKKIKDIEILFTDASANPDKSVTLVGGVRNGKDHSVKEVSILVTFTKADGSKLTEATKVLAEPIHPGEERTLIVKAPNAEGFAGYTFTYKFAPVKEAPASALDALSKGL